MGNPPEMEILETKAAARAWTRAHRAAGRKVAFVPTMGYLHDGHLSLVRAALQRAQAVIVSIYVNPTQFAPNEDFGSYPRDPEGDLAKLRALGVHAVFQPPALYVGKEDGPPHETFVQAETLQVGLCSMTRPHFFRGVATVVTKLFNIVEPDVAVFGKKDYQQWRIIQRLVRDLDFDIDVVGMPLAREEDGIAMSSRNVRLKPDERKSALAISRALFEARDMAEKGGEKSSEVICKHVSEAIAQSGGVVDYVEVRDQLTLQPVETLDRPVVIPVAAKYGTVRLLDNVEIGGEAN